MAESEKRKIDKNTLPEPNSYSDDDVFKQLEDVVYVRSPNINNKVTKYTQSSRENIESYEALFAEEIEESSEGEENELVSRKKNSNVNHRGNKLELPESENDLSIVHDEFLLASTKEQVCELLIDAREKAGMTQKEVAEKMGTSRENVIRMEKGRTNFTYETLSKYSSALGKTLKITLE